QTMQLRGDEEVSQLLKNIESDLEIRLGQQTLSDFILSNETESNNAQSN
ncbi:MAG: hypothetical protein ACI9KM_001889, partial [Rubritalea sp.]